MKQLWYAVTLIVKISGNGSEKGLKMKTSYANKEMKTIFHVKKRQFAIGSPKTEYK